jgi:Fe-S-cluster containining protein
MHVGGMTDYEFTEYLRWIEGHVGVETFIKNFRNRDVEMQIKNPCKHLIDNKDGTYSCAIQDNKPDICKRYPEEDYKDEVSEKCGFRFVP